MALPTNVALQRALESRVNVDKLSQSIQKRAQTILDKLIEYLNEGGVLSHGQAREIMDELMIYAIPGRDLSPAEYRGMATYIHSCH